MEMAKLTAQFQEKQYSQILPKNSSSKLISSTRTPDGFDDSDPRKKEGPKQQLFGSVRIKSTSASPSKSLGTMQAV